MMNYLDKNQYSVWILKVRHKWWMSRPVVFIHYPGPNPKVSLSVLSIILPRNVPFLPWSWFFVLIFNPNSKSWSLSLYPDRKVSVCIYQPFFPVVLSLSLYPDSWSFSLIRRLNLDPWSIILLSKSVCLYSKPLFLILISHLLSWSWTYLIFVSFFTQPQFEVWKFYTW